jgi:hypothetical protein
LAGGSSRDWDEQYELRAAVRTLDKFRIATGERSNLTFALGMFHLTIRAEYEATRTALPGHGGDFFTCAKSAASV